jgi:hypothetical protein
MTPDGGGGLASVFTLLKMPRKVSLIALMQTK